MFLFTRMCRRVEIGGSIWRWIMHVWAEQRLMETSIMCGSSARVVSQKVECVKRGLIRRDGVD